MKTLSALFLPALLLLLLPNVARADCVIPHGVEADIIYSKDYKVYQFCDGTDWMSMAAGIRYVAGGNPPTDCPNVGDVCSDGSVFAGLDGGVPLYTTRCDAGMAWNGSACTGGRGAYPWNNGNSSGYVSVGTPGNGAANTATLIATDSDSVTAGIQPHQAAQYCADLIAHGQGDWYLPSKNELNILCGNRAQIGNFIANYYRSSSEYSAADAWRQEFGACVQNGNWSKSTGLFIRCARR